MRDCTFSDSAVFFEQHGPSGPTLAFTVFGFWFTIAIECCVHLLKASHKIKFTHHDCDAADTERAEENNTVKTKSPSRMDRIYRALLATILLGLITLLFSLRMDRLKLLRVWPECGVRKEYRVQPNWTAIFFFNIVPFTIGVTAWLRAIVDLYLLRKGRTVPYPTMFYPVVKGRIGWPPVLPLYPVYLAIMIPLAWLGGVKADQEDKRFEMDGEEAEGLLGDDRGSEGEAPPPYEQTLRTEIPGTPANENRRQSI